MTGLSKNGSSALTTRPGASYIFKYFPWLVLVVLDAKEGLFSQMVIQQNSGR